MVTSSLRELEMEKAQLFSERCTRPCASAAIRKCHRPGGLNHRPLLSCFWGLEVRDRGSAGLLSSEGPEGRICSGPFSWAYKCLSPPPTPTVFTSSFFCPCLYSNSLYLEGHQSYWIRIHSHDLILT